MVEVEKLHGRLHASSTANRVAKQTTMRQTASQLTPSTGGRREKYTMTHGDVPPSASREHDPITTSPHDADDPLTNHVEGRHRLHCQNEGCHFCSQSHVQQSNSEHAAKRIQLRPAQQPRRPTLAKTQTPTLTESKQQPRPTRRRPM